MFSSFSLRTKLILPAATVFLLLLVVALLAARGQMSARAELREQKLVREQSVELAMGFEQQVRESVLQLYQTLTWESVGFDAAQIRALDQRIGQTVQVLAQPMQQRLADAAIPEEEKALLQPVVQQLSEFAKATRDTLDMKSSAQGLALAAMSLTTAEAAAANLEKSLAAFETYSRQQADSAILAAEQRLQRAMVQMFALVAMALVLGAVLVVYGYRSVRRPIAELQSALDALSAGDLSRPLVTAQRDELGHLVMAAEGLRQRLHEILAQVAQSSAEVTTASREIAAGTQDLSTRTEHQSGALQQTASTMEQMSSAVSKNAEAAQQASRLGRCGDGAATQGSAVVGRVVDTMQEISAQSRRIGEIIGVIDGIAFQTNILALNAAVEAARAGEQGRGFAVVATEVRTLAQRSATAAREIKSLISTSVEQVERGSGLVIEAGSTIEQVVQEVERVAQTIQQITRATDEQNQGIGAVTQAVSQIDQMTQQNAALVEQSSAAAESLRGQATRLSAALGVFRLQA
ncbi:MAG: HAMP domain-containing protein [Aquincola sp.]|nr:HAMP domain-containing protein [Aquincola sp.]